MNSSTHLPSCDVHNVTSTLDCRTGTALLRQGETIDTLLAAITGSATAFGIQLFLFLLLRARIPRIYLPRSHLIHERIRVKLLPGIFSWPSPLFAMPEMTLVEKCGLDAYFFLRYLRMILKFFLPVAMVILPILVNVNRLSGGHNRGLDQLSISNVASQYVRTRLWVHLILAIGIIIWFGAVIYQELRNYIHIRQTVLMSPQHRIRPSATTMLVMGLPRDWQTPEALSRVYDVFPGGIKNVWINRKLDEMATKVEVRNQIVQHLEEAETRLIRMCYKQRAHVSPKMVEEEEEEKKEEEEEEKKKEEEKSGDKIRDNDPAHAHAHADEHAHAHAHAQDEDGKPRWCRFIQSNQRETMRLPIVNHPWFPAIPGIGKKTDKIEHLRNELARLNEEIEHDQAHENEFPVLDSAFVQFNDQIAAHMAGQSLSHHAPLSMAPRLVEMNPDDVIWSNMSVTWWERYIRTALAVAGCAALIAIYAIPVAFTSFLSQIDYISTQYPSFRWLHQAPTAVKSIISGLLPPLLLNVLLSLLPFILGALVKQQGVITGARVELGVQRWYFAFLFIQIFFVVTLSTGVMAFVNTLASNPSQVMQTVAISVPKAADYFFSYLLVQGLGNSASALIQWVSLVKWFILAPLLDLTPRDKWKRQTTNLNEVNWGSFFPLFTNFAVIGIIYSIIAPLILIFMLVIFSLFWIVYRYNILYVYQFRCDTGGLLFPTAVNQLFTGIYVLELCLIGYFFVSQDGDGALACIPQGVIMVAVMVLTVIYQWQVNSIFQPLFQCLPITLEDQAVKQDQEFARAQQDKATRGKSDNSRPEDADLAQESDGVAEDGRRSDNRASQEASSKDTALKDGYSADSASTQNGSKEVDAEAQHQALTCLYQSPTNLQDLTPDARESIVCQAFVHPAQRVAPPVIWLPADELGVSDDEIKQTGSNAPISSNEGATLNSKGRVVHTSTARPPDFRDFIAL